MVYHKTVWKDKLDRNLNKMIKQLIEFTKDCH